MKSTYRTLFFISLVSVLSATAFAQTPQSTTTLSKTPKTVTRSTSTLAVVADVNLTDIKVTESNGALQVGLSLQSFRGQQNNIVYGVVVYDDNFNILAVTKEGSVAELPKGIIVRKNFSYTLPTFITGKVKILLEATTESGLRLGSKEIWSGALKGTRSFNCSYIATSKVIQCSSIIDQKLTTDYSATSLFTTAPLTDIKNAKSGGKVTFDPTSLSESYPLTSLPAGDYNAIISNAKGENQVLQFKVEGEYGTIKNVIVFQKKKGTVETTVLITANLSTEVSDGLSFLIRLVDQQGTLCAEKTLPVTMTIIQTNFDTTCTKGTFTATLLNSDGKELDTTSQPFAVLAVEEEKPVTANKENNTTPKIPVATAVATLVALGVLAGVGVYIRKRMSPTVTN